MRYEYPVTLERDEDGRYVATSRDIPEAVTDGTSIQQALLEMSEALSAALAGYSIAGHELPAPSKTRRGEYKVPVTPLVAAKLALRAAMQAQGISNVTLAGHLKVSEGAVRRLVNPDHASRLDGVVSALSVLGYGLIIEDRKQVAAYAVHCR